MNELCTVVPTGAKLPLSGSGQDYDLALQHAPILRLDADEPFVPLIFGYSLFREVAKSPSSKFVIEPKGALTIEYAIWYDWDIQHLYDLEHVWVHLDVRGEVIAVDGSFHGAKSTMEINAGLPEINEGRPVLFAEPGKHALWAVGAKMEEFAGELISTSCNEDAGSIGIHLGNPFGAKGLIPVDALSHRLATRKLQRDRFVPGFNFTRTSEDGDGVRLMPWTELADWIPSRVDHLKGELPDTVPHLAAVFLDCGDTLIDESTEIKLPSSEVVISADEIPHAMQAVADLSEAGYPLALVADGPRGTFENLLKPRNVWQMMQTHAISSDVSALKPSPLMFQCAMDGLKLGPEDRGRVVMVGNNLSRDIKGANDFGLTSLFVAWSKKRSHAPADASETPDYTIETLDELPKVIEAIELSLPLSGSQHE